MKYLLNRQADGWMMLDPEGNRSLGLFDSEEAALERAWSLASSDGIDAIVYSRDGMDDDSIIVISGLKRCPGCDAMRPSEDFVLNGNGSASSGKCVNCRGDSHTWPEMVVVDDPGELLKPGNGVVDLTD
jgi:hypothetical protein